MLERGQDAGQFFGRAEGTLFLRLHDEHLSRPRFLLDLRLRRSGRRLLRVYDRIGTLLLLGLELLRAYEILHDEAILIGKIRTREIVLQALQDSRDHLGHRLRAFDSRQALLAVERGTVAHVHGANPLTTRALHLHDDGDGHHDDQPPHDGQNQIERLVHPVEPQEVPEPQEERRGQGQQDEYYHVAFLHDETPIRPIRQPTSHPQERPSALSAPKSITVAPIIGSPFGSITCPVIFTVLKRYLIFLAGLFVNSLGVALITKANLGTSPISSIPYVLSLNFALSLGNFTIIFSILLIVLQIVILGKNFKPESLLQIPVSIAFGFFIDFSMILLNALNPQMYAAKVAYLLIGCLILGVGVYMEVLADVVMLPGESFVRAVVARWETEFGVTKIAFDVSMAVIAAAASFFLARELNGVREGTIVAALLVGFIARTIGKKLHFLPGMLFE